MSSDTKDYKNKVGSNASNKFSTKTQFGFNWIICQQHKKLRINFIELLKGSNLQ